MNSNKPTKEWLNHPWMRVLLWGGTLLFTILFVASLINPSFMQVSFPFGNRQQVITHLSFNPIWIVFSLLSFVVTVMFFYRLYRFFETYVQRHIFKSLFKPTKKNTAI